MTFDVYVNSNRDIELDPTGDIRTTTGEDNALQQYMNAAFRAIETVDPVRLDANVREDIKIEFLDELDDLGYTDNVENFQLEMKDHDTVEITVAASGVTRSEEVTV